MRHPGYARLSRPLPDPSRGFLSRGGAGLEGGLRFNLLSEFVFVEFWFHFQCKDPENHAHCRKTHTLSPPTPLSLSLTHEIVILVSFPV